MLMPNVVETDRLAARPLDPVAFTDRLEKKLCARRADLAQSEVYRLVAAPDRHPMLVAAIIKYIPLEVFSYGPHVTEATFTAIGRLPKDRPDLMKPMILHAL